MKVQGSLGAIATIQVNNSDMNKDSSSENGENRVDWGICGRWSQENFLVVCM